MIGEEAVEQFVATGGDPVTLQRPPISDASASNVGTLDTDLPTVAGDGHESLQPGGDKRLT